MSSEDVPAAPNPKNYRPDHIVLYGIKLNVTNAIANIPFQGNRLRLSVAPIDDENPYLKMVIAVIYGYAFEGHCYRLDKPKLFIFEPSTAEAKADGCGFGDGGYAMWQITAKTPILELSTNADLAEELLLNANLPGNRSPNTYGNSFALAHRNGRLTRAGGQ